MNISGDTTTVLTWVATIAIIATGFLLWGELTRRKNMAMTMGKILCQMWTEAGPVINELVPYNGVEVHVKYDGKILPSQQGAKKERRDLVQGEYFANANSTGFVWWPYTSGWMKAFSVQVPIAAWREGNSEPISKREKVEIIGTPALIHSYRDENFALMSGIYDAEIDELKKKLQAALLKQISPIIVYGVLIMGLVIGTIAIWLYYGVAGDVDEIKYGLGL